MGFANALPILQTRHPSSPGFLEAPKGVVEEATTLFADKRAPTWPVEFDGDDLCAQALVSVHDNPGQDSIGGAEIVGGSQHQHACLISPREHRC